MKKKDKIYDSPEYKQIREHLPEILKEMERDKGLLERRLRTHLPGRTPQRTNPQPHSCWRMCSDHSWHWSRSCGRTSGADFDGAGG